MNEILKSPSALRMASYILPFWLFNNKEIPCILEAVGRERDETDAKDLDVIVQFFPQTATWGLKYWERLLGIPVNESLPIEARRNRVMARRTSRNPVNPKRIQTAVMQTTGALVDVYDYFADYTFGIEIYQQDNAPVNLAAVIREVKRLKPSAWSFQLILSQQATMSVIQEVLIRTAEYPACGELVCGAWPEENRAVIEQADILVTASSYQVSQPYLQAGT
ncbi:MAG: YmfQ family protein, partial [Firmicutes bacterium]|nr:YmfQ family protein [Bacillota bacterium]